MESLKKVGFERFINRIYVFLQDYYMDEEMEESFNKAEIIRMLKHVRDERFLNQIRTLLKLHVEKKGGSAC